MVATFHLHCLGHRIKYGNPEVGNTTQQFLSTTQPCCNIEFIESFLFWVILVTYNIGKYICIYIFIKLAIFILFFVIFYWKFFSALHAKHFEIWKNFETFWDVKLVSQLFHCTIHQVIWYFWVFIANPFSLLWSIFFLKKTVFSLVSLSLSYHWVDHSRYFW